MLLLVLEHHNEVSTFMVRLRGHITTPDGAGKVGAQAWHC